MTSARCKGGMISLVDWEGRREEFLAEQRRFQCSNQTDKITILCRKKSRFIIFSLHKVNFEWCKCFSSNIEQLQYTARVST